MSSSVTIPDVTPNSSTSTDRCDPLCCIVSSTRATGARSDSNDTSRIRSRARCGSPRPLACAALTSLTCTKPTISSSDPSCTSRRRKPDSASAVATSASSASSSTATMLTRGVITRRTCCVGSASAPSSRADSSRSSIPVSSPSRIADRSSPRLSAGRDSPRSPIAASSARLNPSSTLTTGVVTRVQPRSGQAYTRATAKL